MEKGKWLCILICGILAAALAGCGRLTAEPSPARERRTEETDGSPYETSSSAAEKNHAGVEPPPEAEGRETLTGAQEPAEGMPEVRPEGIRQSLVLVEAGERKGSGVLVAVDAALSTVATAAHVVEGAETVKLTFADGSSEESSSVLLSEHGDLAFVRSGSGETAADGRPSGEALAAGDGASPRAAVLDKESYDELNTGDPVMAAGYERGEKAVFIRGEVLEPWIYVEDFDQNMMLVTADPEPGMSGGGVFDGGGHLVGILCGSDEEGRTAVLPLGILLSEFSLLP